VVVVKCSLASIGLTNIDFKEGGDVKNANNYCLSVGEEELVVSS
jgi:hypothetical protein